MPFRITAYPLVSDGDLEKPSLLWWLVFDRILFCAGFLGLIVRIIFPSLLADHVAHLPKTLSTTSEGFGNRLSREISSKQIFSC